MRMNDEVLEYLEEDLSQRIVTVTFKKKNGEIRVMECTKNLALVPPSKWPKSLVKDAVDDESVLKVFDVNAQGWRSFIIDNVIQTRSAAMNMQMPAL